MSGKDTIERWTGFGITMSLDCQPGDTILYAYPDNGYEYHRVAARTHLIEGHPYTIDAIEVGSSSSRVRLREVPGVWFNSVQFADPTD